MQRLAVTEGGAFKKDQLLVQFDCSLQQAQLNKAHAGQNAADKTWRANQRLAQLNSVGKVELETSQAEVQKAAAEVAASKALLDKCRVTAPYAGRVAEQKIREQQYAQPGQPLLDIIDDTALELEFLVPSRWLVWLKPGAAFQVRIDETGKTYPAKVQWLAAGRPGEPVHQGERRHRRAFRRPDRRHERTGADGTAAGPLTRPGRRPAPNSCKTGHTMTSNQRSLWNKVAPAIKRALLGARPDAAGLPAAARLPAARPLALEQRFMFDAAAVAATADAAHAARPEAARRPRRNADAARQADATPAGADLARVAMAAEAPRREIVFVDNQVRTTSSWSRRSGPAPKSSCWTRPAMACSRSPTRCAAAAASTRSTSSATAPKAACAWARWS